MATEHRNIQVLVVSRDVSILHEIAWMLDAVGYDVQTSTDTDEEALWHRYSLADVVILDGREVTDPAKEVFGRDSDRPYYRIFLYNADQTTDFGAWFAAGAHDGLRAPVSRGELLSRIRTGARYVEFERRLHERSPFTPLSGMYSRRGFARKLNRIRANDELAQVQHTVLTISIDWYAGIRRKSGDAVAQKLVNKAARGIRRTAGDNAICAYLRNGVFVTLLLNQSAHTAKSIAESLTKEFGNRESLPESIPSPTLTCAVTSWTCENAVDRLLNDALETLKLGGQSGGDRIITAGEFCKELDAWQQEMSQGNPFANVVAQDIMEPFPATPNRNGMTAGLLDALHAGAALRAYLEGNGYFAGAATNADAKPGSTENAKNSMAEAIANDATFPEIYEAFTSRGCTELVVTAGDRPIGYITCDYFMSIIDPIDAESFTHTNKSIDDLAFLVVTSTVGEPSAELVSAAKN